MVWQGPRIRCGAETGTQVIYHRLEYDFFLRISCLLLELFLSVFPCFSSPRRPCAGVFLFFVLLSPCSSFSSCSLSDLLAPFVFCVISGFLLLCFYCHFFCYYFLVRLVFVMLSYPVRWHFTYLVIILRFFGVFSVSQSVTTEFVSL